MSDSLCGDEMNCQIRPKAVDNAIMHTSRPRSFHRPARKYEKNLMIFLLKGEVLANSQEYAGTVLHAGGFILQAIGSKLEILAMTDVECVCYSFNQPELFCEQYYDHVMSEILAPLTYSPLKIIPELQCFLEGSKNYLSGNKIRRGLLSPKRKELGFILGYYYSDYDLSSLVHPLSQYTNSFQYFILRSYIRMKTVEELVHMGGCSVTTLRCIFNIVFHESAYEWMLKRRKEGIMYDLKHINTAISEIRYKHGFESLPHFSSFCKKSFDVSPQVIRDSKGKQLFCPQKVDIHPFQNTYIW